MKTTSSFVLPLSDREYHDQASRLQFPYPIIGVMGGMGPDATADLYQHIIEFTRKLGNAHADQAHLPVQIASYPHIPDRTKYILSWLGLRDEPAEDPFPYLVRSYLEFKEKPGITQKVKYVGVPCATAHFFVPALQEFIKRDGSDIQLIHMLEETKKRIQDVRPAVRKVGVLATTGSLQARLYQTVLEDGGFEVVTPSPEDQENLVMDAIYGYQSGRGIKGGFAKEPRERLQKAVEKLRMQGAEVIVTGCTEIPLVLTQRHIDVLLINPTEVLARRLVELTLASKHKILGNAAAA